MSQHVSPALTTMSQTNELAQTTRVFNISHSLGYNLDLYNDTMENSQRRLRKRTKREGSTQLDSDSTATLWNIPTNQLSWSDEEGHQAKQSPRPGKRSHNVTLYDAVAGRVGAQGYLTFPVVEDGRDTLRAEAEEPLAPEEFLFSTKGAPLRYDEDDFYFADRELRSDQSLPDSDLLKTLHRYAADYCANATQDRGKSVLRSLDETALLALGVLIEETASMAMGRTGYLALLEVAEDG